MIDLSGAQPAWPAAALARWQDCVRRAATEPDLWTTPAPQGEESLRTAIAARFHLRPERLTITSGLRAACLTYARTARHVAVERPTFAGAVAVLGGGPAAVSHHTWRQLLDGPLPPGATLWLTSPGRNPDGASLSAADRETLQRRVRTGHAVVVNGAYRWYAPDAAYPAGADVLGSFSKVGGMGCRLGWVDSDTYFARAAPELLGTSPPRVWQRAWALFLGGGVADGGFEHLRRACVDGPAEAAAAFRRAAAEHGLPPCPGAGPNVLLDLAPGLGEADACDRLARLGYRASEGRHFGAPRPALRLTFTTVDATAAAAAAAIVARSGLTATGDRAPVASSTVRAGH